MPKKFLITGGAGFLGINLCRYLVARGHRVASIDIADFNYPDVQGKVKAVKGDIRDSERLEEAMEGADVVVHCAAALPLYTREEIFSVDVDGTENVLRVAKRLGVKRVIFISSTAVYGVPDHHPIYEHDRLRGVGPYGEAKILAEKKCEEYRKLGMCVPILRPKSFVGPERLGVFAILFDWVRRGSHIPLIGNGKNRYQLLDVEDLCDAIYLCATKPTEVVNNTFNIGAKKFTTMKEDFYSVLDYAGHGKKIITTPSGPAVLLLKILERLKLSPLYQWVYETADKDSFVSVEKAEKLLGFKPKHSNKQALIRTYKWYVEHYNEYRNRTGVTHRVPWKQGALSIVRLLFKL